jgi:NADH-quinone oxidoreductase subunit I
VDRFGRERRRDDVSDETQSLMKCTTCWRNAIQIAKAMAVTLRRGFASSGCHAASVTYFSHAASVTYFRGQPMLRRDGDYGRTPCTACGMCMDVCPTRCIRVAASEGEPGTIAGVQFEVDLNRCMYCGICASACPVEAIALAGECVP